jgi:hypothetical protein
VFVEYVGRNTLVDLSFSEFIELVYNLLTRGKESVELDDVKFNFKINDGKKCFRVKVTYPNWRRSLSKLKLINPEYELVASYKNKKVEAEFVPDAIEFRKVGKKEYLVEDEAIIKNKKVKLDDVMKVIGFDEKLRTQVLKKVKPRAKKIVVSTKLCIDKIVTE